MFTDEKVRNVINKLKPHVFVSEAHLQLAFAMQASRDYSKYFDFYPEFPVRNTDKKDEFDLMIRDLKPQEDTLIEFKYKTAGPVKVTLQSGVIVELANQAAQDNGYYDCWSDISRIETYVKTGVVKNGFFILITNDKQYWEEGINGKSGKKSVGDLFMCEGIHLANSSRGFTDCKDYRGHRNNKINIRNEYNFKYEVYKASNEKKQEFKSLIVEINK